MSNIDDDANKSIEQIVIQNGFKFESYEVTTEDGYILQLHRILGENGSLPVLLQHGIEDSSEQWILNSADRAPAFILARNGFDVWLGNNRGNIYSERHKTLSKD